MKFDKYDKEPRKSGILAMQPNNSIICSSSSLANTLNSDLSCVDQDNHKNATFSILSLVRSYQSVNTSFRDLSKTASFDFRNTVSRRTGTLLRTSPSPTYSFDFSIIYDVNMNPHQIGVKSFFALTCRILNLFAVSQFSVLRRFRLPSLKIIRREK